MNYPKMKDPKKLRFSVDDFSAGMSAAQNKEGNSLSYTLNTELENGSIKRRRAFKSLEHLVGQAGRNYAEKLIITDAETVIDGIYCRLAAQYTALGNFSYRYAFKFFSADGCTFDAGGIDFIRGEDGGIKMPESIICFTATPQRGCGIFAFITIRTNTTAGCVFEAYELSDDKTYWIPYSDEDIYIPDYYVGGRGTMHHLCDVDLPEPEFYEPLNILNSVCNCYYTTDGVSTMFRIPLSDIDKSVDGYLKLELLADYDTTLKFTFEKNSGVSNVVEYRGYEVQIACNNGFCAFYSSPTGYIPEKIYGTDNNLKITVKYTSPENAAKRANMTLGGYYNFSGTGSRLVLSGNTELPSLLAMSAENNPLYIPESNCVYIGGVGQRTVAVSPIGDELIILKDKELYKVDVTSNKIRAELLNDSIGCSNINSVASVGRRVIFLGFDGKLYAVGSDGTLTDLSDGIAEQIKAIGSATKVFALGTFGRYYLAIDGNICVLNFESTDSSLKNAVWSIWTVPQGMQLTGGIANGAELALVGRALVPEVINYYIAVMDDSESDTFYRSQYYEFAPQSSEISAEIHTHTYYFGSRYSYKALDKLLLSLEGSGALTIDFTDESGAIIHSESINISSEEQSHLIRCYPFLKVVGCALRIRTLGRIKLDGLCFEYHNIVG